MKKIYGRSSNHSSIARAINRSGTASQLPYLKDAQTARQTQNKSTYLTSISKQIGNNIEYDDLSERMITKQQSKLKNILKRIHEDSTNILMGYTPRPQNKSIHHKTAAALLALQEKQSSNNQQLLSRYQQEVGSLVEKVEYLEVRDKQFYENQIRQLKMQIADIQDNNSKLKQENDKRGNTIVMNQKYLQQGIFRKIQTDKYLLQHKLTKLRTQNLRALQQITQYNQKLQQIQPMHQKAEKYLKDLQKKNKESIHKLNKQKQFAAKKLQLQNYRKKNQFYNVNNQYKYYRLLQKLELINSNIKEYQMFQEQIQVKIGVSGQHLERLESKLASMVQKRKDKERHLNQFLEQSQFRNTSNTAKLRQLDITNKFNNMSKQQRQQIILQPQLPQEQLPNQQNLQKQKQPSYNIDNNI